MIPFWQLKRVCNLMPHKFLLSALALLLLSHLSVYRWWVVKHVRHLLVIRLPYRLDFVSFSSSYKYPVFPKVDVNIILETCSGNISLRFSLAALCHYRQLAWEYFSSLSLILSSCGCQCHVLPTHFPLSARTTLVATLRLTLCSHRLYLTPNTCLQISSYSWFSDPTPL